MRLTEEMTLLLEDLLYITPYKYLLDQQQFPVGKSNKPRISVAVC